jgi:hypothetical protein
MAVGEWVAIQAGAPHSATAVAANREALKEWTRERVPLDWARTQGNLGTALEMLGERESGTGNAVLAHETTHATRHEASQ